MSTLFQDLHKYIDRPVGTVVHLGAGQGQSIERYARLNPLSLLYVEGDPDQGAELQRRIAKHPWAEAQLSFVTTDGSPALWNRFNVPALNGPLDAQALKRFYPRLRLTDALTRESVALSALLSNLEIHRSEKRINALVLDVPGQEDALLASLSLEQLTVFNLILLRGSSTELPPHGKTADEAVAQLQRRYFRILKSENDLEPLWPVSLLRFETQRHEIDRLRDVVARTEAKLKTSQESVDNFRRENELLLLQLHRTQEELEEAFLSRQGTLADLEKVSGETMKKVDEIRWLHADVQNLKSQLEDARTRNELMRTELMKAEGQLQFVKELLLTEPTL